MFLVGCCVCRQWSSKKKWWMMHATTVKKDKMKMVTRAIIHGSIGTLDSIPFRWFCFSILSSQTTTRIRLTWNFWFRNGNKKGEKTIRRLVSVNKSTVNVVCLCVFVRVFPFSYLGLAERRTKKRRNVKKGNRSSRWLPPDWPFLYNSSSFSLYCVGRVRTTVGTPEWRMLPGCQWQTPQEVGWALFFPLLCCREPSLITASK